jgi:hypothetical protein
MRRISLIVLLVVVGCGSKMQILPNRTITSDVVHDDDDKRNFIKEWHYQVTPAVQMNVTSKLQPWLEKCDSWSCSPYALTFSDKLKQNDGNWILFDCDNVAEKIIDRDLVLKVEDACKTVHSAATDYWKSNNDPSEFTDASGRVWKRQ